MQALLVRSLLAAGLAGCPALAQTPEADAGSAPKLDIDRVLELAEELRLSPDAHLGWLSEGAAYLARDEQDALVVVEAESGARRRFLDEEATRAAFSSIPEIDAATAADWTRRASRHLSDEKDALLVNAKGDLFHLELGAEKAVRLTRDLLEEENERRSPDGSLVAYVSDHDLFVVSTDGGPPRPLTTGGDANRLHGRLDWLYQEEIYGRGNWQGFWWSPDSRWIAFLILDQTGVPRFTIPDDRDVHPALEVLPYPKAGDPNPVASLAVVQAAGGRHRLLDLARWGPEGVLIVRVGWTPDASAVLFQVQDRIQTWLDVALGDPRTGDTRVLFRERTSAWVEPTDAPYWVETTGEEGEPVTRFLWLSERDGWRHLYLYGLDGALVKRLTEGRWEVDEVHGYDARTGWVYFSADKADVKGQQLFRVRLDGTGLEQITLEPGTHRISISPDFAYYVDRFSSHAEPPRMTLCRIDGSEVRRLAAVDAKLARDAGLEPPEFLKVETRDGFEMEAMLVKPAGFDPSRRYPVVCQTYAGPHAPLVRDSYFSLNGLFHQMLAQEGFLIWVCDNRSASGKGLESAATVYKNFGPLELRDLEDGIDWLVAEGYADPERIALWGWSYGGYMTAYALTHSDRFKAGIIGAAVTDWRLYDTVYTERYMDTPQANPEGYDRASVLLAAEKLCGRALIIHGAIDENVHAQNSLQLAHALQEAGHSFQLMLYPGNRHGITRPKQRRHLYATMAEFLRTNL